MILLVLQFLFMLGFSSNIYILSYFSFISTDYQHGFQRTSQTDSWVNHSDSLFELVQLFHWKDSTQTNNSFTNRILFSPFLSADTLNPAGALPLFSLSLHLLLFLSSHSQLKSHSSHVSPSSVHLSLLSHLLTFKLIFMQFRDEMRTGCEGGLRCVYVLRSVFGGGGWRD